MNIRPPAGKSLNAHLTTLLKAALPQEAVTGKANDMLRIKPDPTLKGKGVRFVWRKEEFRLTANGKVKWYVWGSAQKTLGNHAECAVVENAIVNAMTPKAAAEAIVASDPADAIVEVEPNSTPIEYVAPAAPVNAAPAVPAMA